MNIVNVGEVFYISVKAKGLPYGERIVENLRSRMSIVAASDELVLRAAHLKAQYAISYADAFAAVTAMGRGSSLVTGDPELRALAEKEQTLKLDWIAN